MDFSWKMVIDAGLISIALVLATLLRAKIPFLQKYLVPNALTAGFLLLPVYNYLLPPMGYATNRLGDLVYHLLVLLKATGVSGEDVAMVLKKRRGVSGLDEKAARPQ